MKKFSVGGGIGAAIVLLLLAGVSIASAALTFSGTSIQGDGSVVMDSANSISIGTSTATGITIGRTGTTVTFPGTVSMTGLTTGSFATSSISQWNNDSGYIATTSGNWAGTWQGTNSSTFYLASNPSHFLTTSTSAYSFTLPLLNTSGTVSINAATPSAAGTMSAADKSKIGAWVDVKTDYGAKGNGVTDDTAAIQNAINSLPASGGVVYFPNGTYIISQSIIIGNGTASAWATRQGVKLVGAGIGSTIFNPNGIYPVVIKSSVAGPAITIQGPLSGWGIENITIAFSTSSAAAEGLKVISGQDGYVRNLTVVNPPGIGIETNTPSAFSGGGAPNTMHNTWVNNLVGLTAANSVAVKITGATSGQNSSYDNWIGLTIVPTLASQTALWIGSADNIKLSDVHITGGVAATGVNFDYTLNNAWPSDIMFYGIDTASSLWVNTGTPGGLATLNHVFGFSKTNGATVPSLANLEIMEPGGSNQQIQYNNNGAFAGASIYQASSTGYIGIGTTTPKFPLEVNGSIVSSDSGANRNQIGIASDGNGGAYNDFSQSRYTNATSGINSWDWSFRKSNVFGETPNGLVLYATHNNASGTIDDYYVPILFQNNGNVILAGASTSTIPNVINGNVGIGTVSPSVKLQVAGASSTIRIGDSALPGCLEVGNSDGSAGINYVTFLNGTITATTTQPANCQ